MVIPGSDIRVHKLNEVTSSIAETVQDGTGKALTTTINLDFQLARPALRSAVTSTWESSGFLNKATLS